jgi:hypothetical protein
MPVFFASAAGPRLTRLGRRFGQRAAPVGHAELVGDDAQLVPRGGEPAHRQQKILAVQSVDPAGAQDQMRDSGRPYRALAGQLTAAIDIQRVGLVFLAVRLSRIAVEHVIGRIMDQQRV